MCALEDSPRRPSQLLPTGQAGFLHSLGGEVSRERPRLTDILDYQQQAPSHSSVPAGAHQQQWCPLEERLEQLEAEVTDLRKQVLWRLTGRDGVGCALRFGEKERGLGLEAPRTLK